MASDVSSQVEKILYVLGSEGSLHTGVSVLLFVLCKYVDISVHLCCCLFEQAELGGHLCSKLLSLKCLQDQFGKQRSLLTTFDAPQILCPLIVPVPC